MPDSVVKSFVRKVDVGTNLISCNHFTKHYFVSGDDNILKAFEHYPTDNYEKLDWKKSAVKPAIELKDSHALGLTVSASSSATKVIVTGGRDGMVIVRNSQNQSGLDLYEASLRISAHSVNSGGVVGLAIDQSGQFVYTAGGDGSIMINAIANA